jgi:hypothetical protein
MQFGYFTLRDNHYADGRRAANALIADILDQAIYAAADGTHSVWTGEHRFDTFVGLKRPAQVTNEMARFMAEVAPAFAERT